MGGFLNYFIAVLKTIFLYHKGPTVNLKFNNQDITQPSLLVSVMNGQRLGGGFLMAPQAEPDDGLLDLCIADQVSRNRIFAFIPHFLRGTQATQPEINTGQTKQITITAVEGNLPAQTDGEIISVDEKELTIEVLPRQIEIIYRPSEKVK
jgi:diacylglycerol kinase family enzyme